MTSEVLADAPTSAGPPEPAAPARGAAVPPRRSRPLTTIERLRVPMPADRVLGWVVAAVITVIAFVIRLPRLAVPNKLVFDETYYAKDAYSLLRFGYERNWPGDANDKITAGDVDIALNTPAFVVHPPVGKWLIAGGEQLFGMNSFGWRFSSLVFGCLLIFVLVRLVRRVSRSTLIGGLAGVLMTFDGLHFVLSRTALLDIFLAFFLVTGVACLAADRDWFRDRLARHLERLEIADLQQKFGPALLLRPWRIAAGLSFGLALGTKWSTLYVLAAFAVLSLAWDVGARRLAGAGRRSALGLLGDGVPAFVSLVVLSVTVYVITWAGWFLHPGGYDRDWGAGHPDAWTSRHLGHTLASFLHYQKDIYAFHTGDYINHATHSYAADPWGWLIIARPIGIDAVNNIQPGSLGCPGPDTCLQVISGIGTPALWWGAVIALVAAAVLWIRYRDWRFGIPVVGVLSGWLPWFSHDTRPLFFFYAIVIIPFSVMAVALCLGRLIGPADGSDRRLAGCIVAGAFLAVVAANFAYFYPILTDETLPRPQWLARMWFRVWI